MGGRGSSSSGVLTPALLADLPYNVTSYDDRRGGAIYPFLEQTGRAWHIVTRQVSAQVEPHSDHTFGLDTPTLRWVNGDQVSDLYVDGLTTEQFLAATGLALDLRKGGFVLSKRLSRLMRPHFASGFFAPAEVAIAYLEQSPDGAKVWDGAGLISRRMLRKLMAASDTVVGPRSGGAIGKETGAAQVRRERTEAELRHAQRVEFTIMSANGQDKGHAIVADDLRDENGRPVDFLLPRDTKGEIRLNPVAGAGPQTFVGVSAVHGHNEMRLDIQSLINLHPFFQEEQLLGWLRQEGELFTQAVESGAVAEAMGRIDRHTTMEEIQRWPLREYLASGGHPIWFRSHVRSLMNQHLRRLNHTTLGKMRLPIPGGRHYVMPAAVGRRAGIGGLDVPRGHVQIDDRRATAWVNDEDWLALPDSPKGEGIAAILGGADNDDALWLFPFTDQAETLPGAETGERKVLAWRSPNQVGEYVLLKPTAVSHPLPWATAAGDALTYPKADSRQLPPRIDFTDPVYLRLVDAGSVGDLGEGQDYSVSVMEAAIERAIANQGALGMYCNSLMLNKALYGRLPDHPPAPLEEIIDSAVKTGADLSQVVAWNYANSREILMSGISIPVLLHQRLSIDRADRENRPPRPRTSGLGGNPEHWIDRLERGVQAHIQHIQDERERLAALARPPEAILQIAEDRPDWVRLGAGLNQAYAAAIKSGQTGRFPTVLDRARRVAEDYLSHFQPEQRGQILLGALASVYSGEAEGSDVVAWLAGGISGSDRQESGIAHETISALRDRAVLDELVMTKEGLVLFSGVTNMDRPNP